MCIPCRSPNGKKLTDQTGSVFDAARQERGEKCIKGPAWGAGKWRKPLEDKSALAVLGRRGHGFFNILLSK